MSILKKALITLVILLIGAVALVAGLGIYKFNYLANQPGYDVDGNPVTPADQK